MPRRNLIWLAAILAAAGATALVVRTPAPQVGGPPAMPAPLERAQRLIRENYYRPIPAEDLNCAAVSGMVAALDEFSSFIPPEKVDAFQRRMAGKICGLGLVVEFRDGQVRVVGPLPDSPAHRAGLFGGDRILSVNGRAVAAETIEKVRELLDCPDESPVRLELLRAAGRRETVHLAPREFPLETVTGLARGPDGAWIYLVAPDEGIAYFRIREFTEDTGQQFQRAVRQLSRLGGVVLDLRGNPGGARPAAIEVADLFLRDGPIVVIEGRDGQSSPHAAREAGTLPDVPVVVLVDSHTASAAELVAGALRAADRAVLVGERTTGRP